MWEYSSYIILNPLYVPSSEYGNYRYTFERNTDIHIGTQYNIHILYMLNTHTNITLNAVRVYKYYIQSTIRTFIPVQILY